MTKDSGTVVSIGWKTAGTGATPVTSYEDRILWTWLCENRLLHCLEFGSVTFQKLRGDSYTFQVEFNHPDGSFFLLGPCCSAHEMEMPPVSQFEFTVTRMLRENLLYWTCLYMLQKVNATPGVALYI